MAGHGPAAHSFRHEDKRHHPFQTLYGVSFVDADQGIVVGDGGLILRTWNGGEETTAARQSTAP